MAGVTVSSSSIPYKRHSVFTYKRQKVITAILFLAAPLVLLLVFNYLPAINMFFYSFTQWEGFGPIDKFVGLQNYIDVFTKPDYFSVFSTSFFYFTGAMIQLALALYFATLVSFKLRFKNFSISGVKSSIVSCRPRSHAS